MNNFDIKKELKMVSGGGFFCNACLVGKAAGEQSPDPRYCVSCYEFLRAEVKLLPPTKRPGWIPKKGSRTTVLINNKSSCSAKKAVTAPIPKVPLNVPDVTAPDDALTAFIRELAGQGKSCRYIEEELARGGVTMSYRTIARRLQRVLC